MMIKIDIGFGGVINDGKSYADIKGGDTSNTIWSNKQKLHAARTPLTALDLRMFRDSEGGWREIEDFSASK